MISQKRGPHSSPGRLTLSQSEEQQLKTLNAILSATTEFIFLLDKEGRHVFVSENAANIQGRPQSDFLGKTWQEVGLPRQFMQPFEQQRQKVLATGQTVVAEIVFPVLLGLRWFEYIAKPICDGSGDIEFVIVSAKDITQRRQVEDAVYRLASIVESSEDAIIGKTLEGTITNWNGSAEKLYGYSGAEVIGQSVALLFPPERKKELASFLRRIKAGEVITRHETERVRKDGSRVQVSITVSPIRDVQGRISGAAAVGHDITREKRLAEQIALYGRELEQVNGALRQQRDELIRLNSALEEADRGRQYFATMSHELRTPLTSIIGFSQLLLAEAGEACWSRQQRGNLERILDNGHHLLALVSDVLDLSTIEAGRMEVPYTQVDVRELLSWVVEQTHSLALAQHLVVRTVVEQEANCLETSLVKLRQILLNLVSNALKFSEHGEVTVAACRADADHLAFTVKDAGIGIPLGLQERIFDAFYQVDGSYTRRAGGTGLGLSIVHQLTKLLGGTIELASVPGQGSTFTVNLPIKAPPHSSCGGEEHLTLSV